MNFYCIYKFATNKTTVGLLKEACEKLDVNFIHLDPDTFDFSEKLILGKSDALFRVSTSKGARILEAFLLNDEVRTFYHDYRYGLGLADNVFKYTLLQQNANLPIIETIFNLSLDKHLLEKYCEKLGGFPIIVKVPGEQSGRGVIKFDSFKKLFKAVPEIMKNESRFILRKFIKHDRQARIIVLGGEAIASHENLVGNDFRSNFGKKSERKRRVVEYSDEIKAIAVKAVHAIGSDFGAVDILFDEEGKAHLAEVNFPCYFPRTQQLTGIDIAGRMIEYFLKKR